MQSLSYLTDVWNIADSAAIATTIGNYLLGQKRGSGALPVQLLLIHRHAAEPLLGGGPARVGQSE